MSCNAWPKKQKFSIMISFHGLVVMECWEVEFLIFSYFQKITKATILFKKLGPRDLSDVKIACTLLLSCLGRQKSNLAVSTIV